MAEVVGVSDEALRRLVGSGQALLILDGLDEIDPDVGGSGAFLANFVPLASPVLITCRSNDVPTSRQLMMLRAGSLQIFELQPLGDKEIQQFLARDPDLEQVLTQEPVLRNMVRTPLLLTVLLVGFRESPSALRDLSKDSSADLRDSLFRKFFERLYRFEREHVGDELTISLEEIYEALGHAVWWTRGSAFQVFLTETFSELPFEFDKNLLRLLEQMRILIAEPGRLPRFIHPLVHDYFGLPYSLNKLTDSNRAIRRSAARAPGWIGDPRATQPLIAALQDEDSVSSMAAESLGRLATDEAIKALERATRSDRPALRYAAFEALRSKRD